MLPHQGAWIGKPCGGSRTRGCSAEVGGGAVRAGADAWIDAAKPLAAEREKVWRLLRRRRAD